MRARTGLALGLLITVLIGFSSAGLYAQPAPTAPPAPAAQPAQPAPAAQPADAAKPNERSDQPYLINFNNIQIIEVLRFISRITGKNFIFDQDELNFRVTIISEEPTSVSNIMAALLQELRIHNLTLLEQGNNIIIHTNPQTKRIGRLKGEGLGNGQDTESEMITQVYRLLNIRTEDVEKLIKSMMSAQAQLDILPETRHLVVTDLASNIERVTALIDRLDSSRPTLEIGQYLVKNAPVDALATLLKEILEPIAGSQILQITPSSTTNSIFVVSTPYLVEKSLSVLQTLDQTNRQTRILSLDRLEVIPEGPGGVPVPGTAGGGPDELAKREAAILRAILEPVTPAQQAALLAERDRLKQQLLQPNLKPEEIKALQKQIDELNQRLDLLQIVGTAPTALLVTERNRIQAELDKGGLTEPEVKRRQQRLDTLNRQIDALNRGGKSPDVILEAESESLVRQLQDKSLTEAQANDLRARLEIVNNMIKGLYASNKMVDGVTTSQATLESRRQEIEKLLGETTDPDARGALEGEHRDIVEQITQLEAERARIQAETNNRLKQLNDKLDQVISNPPPPVILDIRQDTRKAAPGELTAALPDIVRATQHKIYRLQHRRANEALESFQNIGLSLAQSGDSNRELILTIQSAQALQNTNSLIISGVPEAVEAALVLIEAVDRPRRQVFIEVLILEASITDSLNFGVQWGARLDDQPPGSLTTPPTADSKAATLGFSVGASTLPKAIQSAVTGRIDQSNTAAEIGGHASVIGKTIRMGSSTFWTIGALVKALKTDGKTHIIMTPKVLVEDGTPADLFVGQNTRYQAQTVAVPGSTVTETNYDYKDIGSSIRVTPYISESDLIVLEINQDLSEIATQVTDLQSQLNAALGPTTRVARTRTRAHVPNGYFLVLSGMVRDERDMSKSAIPCLGTLPVVGALFSDRTQTDDRASLLIFIRPTIVDTAEQMAELSKNQYNLYQKRTFTPEKKAQPFDYDIDAGLDFLQ